RAARLLNTAGRLLLDRLDQPAAAIAALQKAATRITAASAEAGPPARIATTRRRIFSCLAPLLEDAGQIAAAAQARLRYVAELREPEAIAHEHIALADLLAALGQHERAVEHARQALARDPLDAAAQQRLDRALERLGRHEERVSAWVIQGN